MGDKSHNPAIEIYSHGKAARKRVNHQGKGVVHGSVDLGEVCAGGPAGDLDSLETLQVSERWIQEGERRETIIRLCDR